VYRFIAALLIVLLSGCSCYDKKSDLSYDQNNVPYGVFDYYKPICDCGCPDSKKPRPAVILIHGGAWQMGDKSDMEKVAVELTKHGYACFSPNYHLTTDYTLVGGQVVKGKPWPQMYNDLRTFLVYLKNSAKTFNIDPDKIASLGISAGGHLAQELHLRDPQMHTVTACDLDGETDLRPPGGQVMTDFDQIMTNAGGIAPVTSDGWSDPKKRTEAMATICLDMSTTPLVTKDSKIFIVHGEEDPNIFVAQGDLLAIALKAAGAEYDYVRIPGKQGACHSNCWSQDKALVRLLAWLDKHLKE
jgi:acetyl esterase/lipase